MFFRAVKVNITTALEQYCEKHCTNLVELNKNSHRGNLSNITVILVCTKIVITESIVFQIIFEYCNLVQ